VSYYFVFAEITTVLEVQSQAQIYSRKRYGVQEFFRILKRKYAAKWHHGNFPALILYSTQTRT